MMLPPLSLYIHIPWCVRKCPYCDFNSHAQPDVLPEQEYVACLIDDLKQDLEYVQGRKLHSIFIGGGTPSLFTAPAIARILEQVQSLIPFEPEIEIVLEANPGTFEVERFEGYVQAGVNRLSIGVQSLNNQHLQTLGRIHTADHALNAIAHTKHLPLQSFNTDIMHGLPQQNLEQALADLQGVIDLGAPHISWYQLTIEPNTLFASKPPKLPDDDRLWEIYEQGQQLLLQSGYQHYEVSAYGLPEHRSKHNINYWRFGDYLGIGCGAHGKITQPLADGQVRILRTEKVKHPRGYMNLTRPFTYRHWLVEPEQRTFEYFMNRLRLLEPIPKQEFVQRTGLPVDVAEQALTSAIDKGLIVSNQDDWNTTERGKLFLNEILTDISEE